jgi:choline transport protein
VINALLGLINIGSSVAFNAIVSLVVAGFLSSYLIPIVIMIFKRIWREPIAFGPWNLGRWGLAINIYAAAYTIITLVFSFFPPSVPVTAVTMNWSCVVYGGVVILGIIFYVVHGHKNYVGPRTEMDLAG